MFILASLGLFVFATIAFLNLSLIVFMYGLVKYLTKRVKDYGKEKTEEEKTKEI